MATIKVILDVRRHKADGSSKLMLAVGHKSQTRYVALGVDLLPEQWDADKGKVKPCHPRARLLNNLVARALLDADDVIAEMIAARAALTARSIADGVALRLRPHEAVSESEVKQEGLFSVWRRVADRKHQSRRVISSRARVLAMEFAGVEEGQDVELSVLTRDWATRWLLFLEGKGLMANTRWTYFGALKNVVTVALDEDLIGKSPLRGIQVPTEETAHRAMSIEHLRVLWRYQAPTPALQEVADVFKLIVMLRGINLADLYELGKPVDGRLNYRRAKTGKLYSIKVEPEMEEIIARWGGRTKLLAIAERDGGVKSWEVHVHRLLMTLGRRIRESVPDFPRITSYWARHTWATLAAELDITDSVISLGLGHSGTDGAHVTMVYIWRNRQKVDDANRRVIDWIVYGKR